MHLAAAILNILKLKKHLTAVIKKYIWQIKVERKQINE
jgi:hypothetical protein